MSWVSSSVEAEEAPPTQPDAADPDFLYGILLKDLSDRMRLPSGSDARIYTVASFILRATKRNLWGQKRNRVNAAVLAVAGPQNQSTRLAPRSFIRLAQVIATVTDTTQCSIDVASWSDGREPVSELEEGELELTLDSGSLSEMCSPTSSVPVADAAPITTPGSSQPSSLLAVLEARTGTYLPSTAPSSASSRPSISKASPKMGTPPTTPPTKAAPKAAHSKAVAADVTRAQDRSYGKAPAVSKWDPSGTVEAIPKRLPPAKSARRPSSPKR